MRKRSWLLAMFALLLAPEASANGRFPRAERVVEDAQNPDHLMLAATYGLLTSSDRGASWSYICEQAFSLQKNYAGDPLLDIAQDGTQLVGAQSSLNRSDDGCGWQIALGGAGDEVVPDYTLTSDADGKRNEILALRAKLEGSSFVTRVLRSRDAGRRFEDAGAPLPVSAAFTIDVAPSNPEVIYVSALTNDGEGVLLASHDAGESFEVRPIPDTGSRDVPYIAAVDARDPRTIYVRTDSKAMIDGKDTANDALLVSKDGGETWTELYRARAKLLGFALSPDGTELAIGYGLPADAQLVYDERAFGLFRSRTSDYEFQRASTGTVTCLTWTQRGLYACTAQLEVGYTVAFAASDALAQSGELTLEPLLDVRRVHGPACCDAPNGGECDAAWLAACFQLEACYTGVDDSAPFTCSGGEAGSGGMPSAAPGKKDDGGCGCRTAQSPPANGQVALLTALSLTSMLWRRRRREQLAP